MTQIFLISGSRSLDTWKPSQRVQTNDITSLLIIWPNLQQQLHKERFWLIFQPNSIMDLEDLPEGNLPKALLHNSPFTEYLL